MTTRSYPRWRKFGHSELFYPHKGRWIYEVHHGPDHPGGRYVGISGEFQERFSSAEEAKSFFESLYQAEHAREKFDFPIQHVPRIDKGTQKVSLLTPVDQCPQKPERWGWSSGFTPHGWLTVRWNPRFSTVKWDYGAIDAIYPDCDRFKLILENTNWDRELIRRLLLAGWQWQNIDRTCMRWNRLREVPHDIAQWILDTLPAVYEQGCKQFSEDCERLSTQEWFLNEKRTIK